MTNIELKLVPTPTKNFPVVGVLIRGCEIKLWFDVLEYLTTDISSLRLYIVPSLIPNSVYGLLALDIDQLALKHDLPVEKVIKISNNLLLLENTSLFPFTDSAELDTLFSTPNFWHPIAGLCPLESTWDYSSVLSTNLIVNSPGIQKPRESYRPPMHIHSFEVIEVKPDEVLKQMEKEIFPKKEKMVDDSLTLFEKLKRLAYSMVLDTKKTESGQFEVSEKKGLSPLFGLLSKFGLFNNKTLEDMKLDMADLEKRNQERLQKLLDMFRENPDEALKYAVPLDTNGSSRGEQSEYFDFGKRWSDFSYFSRDYSSSSGSYTMPDEAFWKLNQQYQEAAQEYIRQKDYEKAAFVYLKLLKNPATAASTLESGQFFIQAASVYEQICKNKNKAAECYEKAKSYQNAIHLYKELKQFEKTGDLLIHTNKIGEANSYYQLAVDDNIDKQYYIRASEILANKMHLFDRGQEILRKGWQEDIDPKNCLSRYLDNLGSDKEVLHEILSLKTDIASDHKLRNFFSIIRKQSKVYKEILPEIKNVTYELIAQHVEKYPSIVEEILSFETKDSELSKDVSKWKVNRVRKSV